MLFKFIKNFNNFTFPVQTTQNNNRKKWLESIGTWTEQGKISKFEEQLFAGNEEEVDIVYFEDSNLIDVEIDKTRVEPINNLSVF